MKTSIKLILTRALALAAMFVIGSAWAATTPVVSVNGTKVTVKNTENNAGGYNWDRLDSTLTVPATSPLTSSTQLKLKSFTFWSRGDSGVRTYADTVTINVGGEAYTTSQYTGSTADNGELVYAFPVGGEPVVTVGTTYNVTFTLRDNFTGLRFRVAEEGSGSDGFFKVANNAEYAPQMLLTAEIYTPSPEPVVVWSGDFKQNKLSKIGTDGQTYTLSINQNAISENGSYALMKTGTNGVYVDWEIGIGAATVIFRCESVPTEIIAGKNSCYATVYNTSSDNRVGVVRRASDGKMQGIWANTLWSSSPISDFPTSTGKQVYALAYQYNKGTLFCCNVDDQWTTLLDASGLGSPAFDNGTIKGFSVLGYRGTSSNMSVLDGAKVTDIAVFKTKLSAEQIAAYEFPEPPTPTKATVTLSKSTFTSGWWSDIVWDNGIKPDANTPAEITIEGDGDVPIQQDEEINAKSITFVKGSGSGSVSFYPVAGFYNGGKITTEVPLVLYGNSAIDVDAGANNLTYFYTGIESSPITSTTGELSLSGANLKAQTVVAPSHIVFDNGATLTIDVSSEKTINGIEGAGTLIKTGAQKLTLNKGSNDYAVDGSTVKIDAGNVNIGSATLKDATFIIGQNCTLDNYGWFNILGTFTVNSDYNVTIFNNSGNDNTSKIGGGANFVKGGTGAVTLRSSTNTGDANDFASVTVNGGKLIFDNAKKYPCITRNLEIASGSTVEIATGVSLNVKGTLSGGGTLCGAGEVIFGADATIDVTAGSITATASTITFGNTLKIVGGAANQTILTGLATEPTLPAVTVDGKTGYLLKYDNGSIKLVKSAATVNGKDYATLEAAIEAAEAAGDTAEITVHVYPGQGTAVAINVNSGKTITLVSDAADPYIFDASFTKTGAGTLILKSGWATMSATINVSEGTLAVADGAWFDWGTKYLSANVTVADGARFDIAYTTTVTTYQTAFSGQGIVCKSGVGSITLDFDNMSNLEGSFELNGGTVIASAGLTLLNGIIVTSATTLEVLEGKKVAASTVTGDGVLTKTGAGALVLDNKPTASITLSAGSIEIPVTDDEIIYGYTASNITVSGGTLYFVNGGKKIAGDGNKLKGTATTWTGNAGNGAWDNEGNWDNGVPTEDQVAMISGAAWGAEITVTADSVAKLLRCDAMGVSIKGAGARFCDVRCDYGLILNGNNSASPIVIAGEINGSGILAGLTIEGAIEFDDVLSKTTINLSTDATLAGSGELQSLQVNTGSILKPNADGFKITETWKQDGGSEDKHPIKVDGSLITAEDIEESLTLISLGTDCKGIINDVTFQNFAAGIGVAKSADNKSIVATKVVAEVNGVKYATVEAALNAIADDAETTVTILVSQAGKTITIPAKKVVKFANGAGVSGFAGGAAIAGVGTVVYEGALPGEEKTYYQNAQNWTGAVWLKNYRWIGWAFEEYGNADSFVKLTGITGYGPNSSDKVVETTIVLADKGTTKALMADDGFGGKLYTIKKLTGDGTFCWSSDLSKSPNGPVYKFLNVKDFCGVLNPGAHLKFVIGNSDAAQGKNTITFADGVSVKAGLGWEAANVVFGKTIAINNVSGEGDIGKVLVSGVTTAPASIPGVLDSDGNDVKDLALGYDETATTIKIVAAGAKTDDGKNYETIEQAINANNGATIAIAKDTTLNVGSIETGKTFKLNADAIKDNKISWADDNNKYLACGSDGTLTVTEGAPKGTFTSFECYALGISTESADKPVLNAPPDNRDLNTLTVSIDTFRNIKGVKLIAVPNDESGTIEAIEKSIPLNLPGNGERIYTIKVDVESTNP